MDDDAPLRFPVGNAKLNRSGYIIHSFSLPSGWTCPGARVCQARVGLDGKLVDGVRQEFRCYSASEECVYRNVFLMRMRHFRILRSLGTAEAMAGRLDRDLTDKARTVRVHAGGDFFSQAYFDAWMEVARRRPLVRFYAYTKSLKFWVARLGEIPGNFVLTASRGGKWDQLIDEHGLKEVSVVHNPGEAEALGLELDHDDLHAMDPECRRFGLLLHGVQPAGSLPALSVRYMKKAGVDHSYGKNG